MAMSSCHDGMLAAIDDNATAYHSRSSLFTRRLMDECQRSWHTPRNADAPERASYRLHTYADDVAASDFLTIVPQCHRRGKEADAISNIKAIDE